MHAATTSHFSTRLLAPEQKGLQWIDVVNRHIINLDCPDEPDTGIDAELEHYDLGEIRFNHIRASSHSVQRTNTNIRNDGRESAFMCFLLGGNGFAAQGTQGSQLAVGDVVLYNTVRPYSLGFPVDMDMMVVDLPLDTLRQCFGEWNQKDLIRFDRQLDSGGYSTANLHRIINAYLQQQASAPLTNERLLEQLSGLLNRRSLSSCSRALPRLLQKSKVFIEQHLESEQLSPEFISQHMHTSSRQLARAFALEGNTVSRYIWNQRLERCRDNILASASHSAGISEIAFRWGFNHSAHFSRSYKLRFGETPTESRQRALQTRAAHLD